ncbi:hypothetical protein [Verrucosispora sp. WMMD573]|uniref:hypothetical protein n=1 Tax=Verrucosispora sp. WMMD573 TaxID=3015149 RepID=UPI00248BF9D9|nr:hypothetical protein [Verrucosispora sp. WMMD573]WBB52655.1 hypothetical protein O7601_18935 [Verrucosispora sp. WMMD573]
MHTVDDTYGPIHVQAWTGLHPKPGPRRRWAAKNTKGLAAPIIRGTVVRVSLTRTVEAGTHKPCGCGPPAPTRSTLT